MSANWYKPFLFVGGVGAGNYYDFRDRMLGFSFEKTVTVSELTTWTLNVTLDNDDGAFTPRTTGTYANLNWFNQLVSLTPKPNQPSGGGQLYDFSAFSEWLDQYFVGVVDTFEIIDDGVNSRLELTVVDFLTIAARAPSLPTLTNGPNQYQPASVERVLNVMTTDYFSGTTALPVPPGFPTNKVELVSFRLEYSYKSQQQGAQLDLTDIDTSGNVADALAASVMPSQSCVVIPLWVDEQINPTRTRYAYGFIGPMGIRSTFDSGNPIAPLYEFVEGSATGDQIPFVGIDIGYQLDKMVNSVQITNVTTSADVDSFNTASVIANGARNASYTALICTTTEAAQTQADRLVNRFSTPRYFPRSITTNYAAISATGLSTTRDTIADLLQLDGLWNRCTVTYTPTGHSTPITDYCVISGVRVDAVPGDMQITFDLLPGVDYQAFVLDSSTLGVLDQNRLG